MSTRLQPAAPSWTALLQIWSAVSLKSVGGGQAVQLHAYNELVNSRQWITPNGWSEAYGLCQVVPGINLVAFALLSGFQLAGWRGAAASTFGLMLPSVGITIGVTVIYASIAGLHAVQAGFRGLVTAAAGMSLTVAWRLLRPNLDTAMSEGRLPVVMTLALLLAAASLATIGSIPVFAVLIGAGVVMGIFRWTRSRRAVRSSDD